MFDANKKKKTLKFDSLIDVNCTKRFMNACKNMACVCVRKRERKKFVKQVESGKARVIEKKKWNRK